MKRLKKLKQVLKNIEVKSKAVDYSNFLSKKNQKELKAEMLTLSYATRIKMNSKLPGLDKLQKLKKSVKMMRI